MTRLRAAALFTALSFAAVSASAQEADRPIRVSNGVMAGLILHKVTPVYPQDAKDQHISGSVVLHAILGKDGTVQSLTVISGPEMLRTSAIEAAR